MLKEYGVHDWGRNLLVELLAGEATRCWSHSLGEPLPGHVAEDATTSHTSHGIRYCRSLYIPH